MSTLKIIASFLLLECVKSQCSSYPLIEHAKPFEGADFIVAGQEPEVNDFSIDEGHVVDLKCKTGYSLLGDSALTCSVDDSGNFVWIGKQYPQCVGNSWTSIFSETSEITPFNSQKEILQLKFDIPYLEFSNHNFKFWCNLNFYINSNDTTSLRAYIRILYNFEESQIVDSVVEYGTTNSIEDQCPFCLDFSAPDFMVPEVITFNLPHDTYYDGILGESVCQKDVLDKWISLMSGNDITGLSHQCYMNKDQDKNNAEEILNFWIRILPKNSSELFCNSAPQIENIAVKEYNFPIQIGTVISVSCSDGYDQTGSLTGTCMGFGNSYNFDSLPKCDKKWPSDGNDTKHSAISEDIDEEPSDAASTKGDIAIKDKNQDNLPWNITLLLSLSFTSMALCCIVLVVQLNNCPCTIFKTYTKNKEY